MTFQRLRNNLILALVFLGLLVIANRYGEHIKDETERARLKIEELRRNASLAPIELPQARKIKEFVTDLITDNSNADSPLEVAELYLEENRRALKLQDYHSWKPVIYGSPLGTHIKYAFYQDDIPIVGMDLMLRIDKDLNVKSVENRYRPLEEVDLDAEPMRSVDELVDYVSDRYELNEDSYNESPILYVLPGQNRPIPSYVVRARDEGKKRNVDLVIRASDGQVVGKSFSRGEF